MKLELTDGADVILWTHEHIECGLAQSSVEQIRAIIHEHNMKIIMSVERRAQ